jgi:threonine/homoserine/homoserine lactone efflux protein
MPIDTTLQLPNIAALFAAMAVLAAIPSVSVLAVAANAASSGLRHGALTALGIVLGDIVFVLTATFGLVLLSDALGSAFVWIKYAGAAYLLVLGIAQWRSSRQYRQRAGMARRSAAGSFMTGLLITLADQKAVLFYLGFLPAFVELETLTPTDIGVIALITLVAVGGVKLAYAFAAARTSMRVGTNERLGLWMHRVAAVIMIGAAVMVLIRS